MSVVEVRIDRVPGGATSDVVVDEAPLELRARGVPVATIMRTPGQDLELVRGLLHAESIAPSPLLLADDAVEIDVDPAAFAGRGLLSTAACGVCGRVAIADLERRAQTVETDAAMPLEALLAIPERLRAAQATFAQTGGLHAAGLFTLDGALVAIREDVGRHNALDKVIGFALDAGIDPARHALGLSGRIGYELVQKAIRFGSPILAAVSAPTSLAIALGERFGVCIAGFVRPPRANLYTHAWRVTRREA